MDCIFCHNPVLETDATVGGRIAHESCNYQRFKREHRANEHPLPMENCSDCYAIWEHDADELQSLLNRIRPQS